MSSKLFQTSKYMCHVLRHNPNKIGLTLDNEGWANVEELLDCANKNGKTIDRSLLNEVVEKNDKKRFAFSPNGTRIRAVQGHSHPNVKINYEPVEPPEILYHGTAIHFVNSIMKKGLEPGKRHHVYLSQDLETATKVGQRHGQVAIILVHSKKMAEDGLKFYRAENGVWLADKVPAEYLSLK